MNSITWVLLNCLLVLSIQWSSEVAMFGQQNITFYLNTINKKCTPSSLDTQSTKQIIRQQKRELHMFLFVLLLKIQLPIVVEIQLNGKTPPYVCACPKQGSRLPTSNFVAFFCVQWVKVRGECSFLLILVELLTITV